MSRVVFILGAGASALAGVPTMDRFIDSAAALYRAGSNTSEDQEAFGVVLKARSKLQTVHSKATLDLNNIESLFGAFEMAALLGKLSDLQQQEIIRLPSYTNRVIARTIEANMRLPVRGSGADFGVLPPPPYEQMMDLVGDIRRSDLAGRAVSLITFNYDVALDYAAHYCGIPIDYCLEGPSSNAVNLLKLHGSLNWGRCTACQRVYPVTMRTFFAGRNWNRFAAGSSVELAMSSQLASFPHCPGCPPEPYPVIAPPTWNKGSHHKELSAVWRTAAIDLSEAEHMFIIGYSLPLTDEFFRYFYALGSVGENILVTVWVVNPDSLAEDRFRAVLGPAALASNCFRYKKQKFEDTIQEIRDHLGVRRPGQSAY